MNCTAWQAKAKASVSAGLRKQASKKPLTYETFVNLFAAKMLDVGYSQPVLVKPTVADKTKLVARLGAFERQDFENFLDVVISRWGYFTSKVEEDTKLAWRKPLAKVPNVPDFIVMFDYLLDLWNEYKQLS